MSAIHVMHVINQLTAFAGAEVSLRDIIHGTSAVGIRHTVVVLKADEHSTATDVGDAPVVAPARTLRTRSARVRHVARAIRTYRPDLIHTSLFEADLAGRLAAHWARVPVLTSLVNTPYGPEAQLAEPVSPAKLRAVRFIDGMLARHATTAFHAISNAASEHAIEHLGIAADSIRVVPRGRSVESLGDRSQSRRAEVREKLNWTDRPVVINVARQEPQKNHTQLVEAMAQVLLEFPTALLVLVGREGRSTPALRDRIRALGVRDCVQELGVRTDVPDLLAAADVFAFSSLYEGLGGAVVEAAGLGVPVASYDLPAVREVLGDDHPWLVPAGDIEGLAANIRDILRGGERIDQASTAERSRFLERYEMSICVAGMADLYRDLAATTRRIGKSYRRVPTVSVGCQRSQ